MHTFYQLGKNMHFPPFLFLFNNFFFPTCYLAIFFGGQAEKYSLLTPGGGRHFVISRFQFFFGGGGGGLTLAFSFVRSS